MQHFLFVTPALQHQNPNLQHNWLPCGISDTCGIEGGKRYYNNTPKKESQSIDETADNPPLLILLFFPFPSLVLGLWKSRDVWQATYYLSDVSRKLNSTKLRQSRPTVYKRNFIQTNHKASITLYLPVLAWISTKKDAIYFFSEKETSIIKRAGILFKNQH
jgi:hypothetical protein